MDDRGERVDLIAVEEDVDLDEVGAVHAVVGVVEGGVAFRPGLELVEEVEDDLGQRQAVADLDAVRGQVVHALELAAAVLAEFHDRADVVARGEDRRLDHRLADLADLAGRELRGVRHDDLGAVLEGDVVDDARGGRDEVEVELALKALADDLEVEEAKEPAAEAEAERRRVLRFVDEGGVVELELVERVAQRRVVGAVDGEEPGEDHRLGLLVAGQGLLGRGCGRGDRVADLRLADVLDTGDEVADLADAESLRRDRLRGGHTDLEEFVSRARRHHRHLLPRRQCAVDDADVGDDTPVGVVDGVEDHRPRRRIGVADGRGDVGDDPVEDAFDALTGLAGDPQDVVGVDADEVRELLGVLVRLRGRQVDLVEHRDDRQLVLHREVEVRERLGLDALRGVDEEERALTGGERPGDLVAEVDVAGGVDHVECVRGAVGLPRHAHGLGFDGDAAFAFYVHPVEVLRAHVARLDDAGDLEHPVGERRLPVVDVGDDAEIADQLG
ncbi:Uncharacterised protein [Mycobacteroides abscessus subsp. abscessus]|nr:Uncharacterised protein [Mycobacteroides abscessus subsp. abscessus]